MRLATLRGLSAAAMRLAPRRAQRRTSASRAGMDTETELVVEDEAPPQNTQQIVADMLAEFRSDIMAEASAAMGGVDSKVHRLVSRTAPAGSSARYNALRRRIARWRRSSTSSCGGCAPCACARRPRQRRRRQRAQNPSGAARAKGTRTRKRRTSTSLLSACLFCAAGPRGAVVARADRGDGGAAWVRRARHHALP